ncbi:phenylacetic acid degradation bifunctional protein PaaZ [Hydrotalea sandarakina]|jgi:oxepin-CoA hydrolase/3-oxo-5,6-dehydrosuberyl-CoA semialdehyde dehydrogenase|uniref:Oxepin-CoA hydrolase/3-oxo-5,6-dehydrosuberyl-CoA semialdehyde dehydrogenase n=1 Tax=Hydrotalea sandarakina TaxID=1004304 RepID=A0A2W7RP24_9BACT|nr:phenylacetic acid degradation bifunctional protein PaaZ [Hydrotalea sandarakina]PZX60706.1 oxepin-CoA hydrolase/3-oxo-5,6-dehydrosuberyl-CoA semialdehyde dehydrogenase [Hydrotalea sandarakina]
MIIESYVLGRWMTGKGEGQPLYHAVTGEYIGSASTEGLNMGEVLDFARQKGNKALRKMTFQQRGLMLKALALHLQQHLPELYSLSYKTGATKADSWVDIEGGIGNLFSYASLRRKLPDLPYWPEGEAHLLGKAKTFMGHHLLLPKEGAAIHINAYNFPVWGMLEKIAVNFMAGVPAIVKPATVGCYLTQAVVKHMVNSGILPEGALQLLCGSTGNLLNEVNAQDTITFTGSAHTGLQLKSNPTILQNNVSFTMEADSLNAIVLAEDVEPGMPEWDLFIKEVRREMTLKCGQRCTGVRRILVPENKIDLVQNDLSKALSQTVIGNPLNEKVRMGSLAGKTQKAEVLKQVSLLLKTSELVYGNLETVEVVDANAQAGAFISPLLLRNNQPLHTSEVHNIEAFGPVSTLMPYRNLEEAITITKLGKGSLVSTIVTASRNTAREYVLEAGTYHGRILILNQQCGKENTGHGSPLPMLVHGGPGRAGGGEEMGGLRGIHHYMQRVALQGSPDMLTAVLQQYQPNATGIPATIHPFKKHFEELEIGYQLITKSITMTSELIDAFANLSGDHFYAHLRNTDFEGTMFTQQVAHGYLLLSLSAGLFVDSYEKNPVLLNYGIDELRFTKPVYPGMSFHVRFTCKEKISQDKKEPTDIARGIVKWLVEMIDDENDELIGIATILTMVKKLEQ